MDAEVKEPPVENGANGEHTDNKTVEEVSPEKNSIESGKSTRQKHKRSRSTTPSSKNDENKTLQINLTKVEGGLNGADAKDEKESNKPKLDTINESDKTNKEDEPITKRTRHQTELAVQENNINKESKQKTPQKTASPKKVSSSEKDLPKNIDTPKKDASKNGIESDSMEMEPLVISDEHEPELQFDELSDKESGKGSPVIPRCVTRRSLTRNIPTPKTPKSVDVDTESEQAPTTTGEIQNDDTPKNDNEETNESTDSTKAEAGSDETRLEYVEKNVTLPIDDSHLNQYRDKSLSETIRCLSARKPIRDTYRNRTFRIQGKTDLDSPFSIRNSVDVTTSGVKRKNRSVTPEETKKFKPETSSFFSSPLANLRGKFRSEVSSSTPLLRGYKDSRSDLHFEDNQGHTVENGMDDKKSWCSLM